MAKDMVALTQEALEEDMVGIRALWESDFAPLLKRKRRLEREAFDEAYSEVQELELEAV